MGNQFNIAAAINQLNANIGLGGHNQPMSGSPALNSGFGLEHPQEELQAPDQHIERYYQAVDNVVADNSRAEKSAHNADRYPTLNDPDIKRALRDEAQAGQLFSQLSRAEQDFTIKHLFDDNNNEPVPVIMGSHGDHGGINDLSPAAVAAFGEHGGGASTPAIQQELNERLRDRDSYGSQYTPAVAADGTQSKGDANTVGPQDGIEPS